MLSAFTGKNVLAAGRPVVKATSIPLNEEEDDAQIDAQIAKLMQLKKVSTNILFVCCIY